VSIETLDEIVDPGFVAPYFARTFQPKSERAPMRYTGLNDFAMALRRGRLADPRAVTTAAFAPCVVVPAIGEAGKP
jgi:hypothetical protein